MEFRSGLCCFRPRGRHSLVGAVELVSDAISTCRTRGVPRLLVDVTGLTDLPIPSLIDRFLMVEDWAQEAKGLVVVAMVAHPEYIHPKKFGVKAALHLGLVCDVFTDEAPAIDWLLDSDGNSFLAAGGRR
jgi:hypothetical protein